MMVVTRSAGGEALFAWAAALNPFFKKMSTLAACELPRRRPLTSLKSNDLGELPWQFALLVCKGLHTRGPTAVGQKLGR